MTACPVCSTKNSADARECVTCGKRFELVRPNPSSQAAAAEMPVLGGVASNAHQYEATQMISRADLQKAMSAAQALEAERSARAAAAAVPMPVPSDGASAQGPLVPDAFQATMVIDKAELKEVMAAARAAKLEAGTAAAPMPSTSAAAPIRPAMRDDATVLMPRAAVEEAMRMADAARQRDAAAGAAAKPPAPAPHPAAQSLAQARKAAFDSEATMVLKRPDEFRLMDQPAASVTPQGFDAQATMVQKRETGTNFDPEATRVEPRRPAVAAPAGGFDSEATMVIPRGDSAKAAQSSSTQAVHAAPGRSARSMPPAPSPAASHARNSRAPRPEPDSSLDGDMSSKPSSSGGVLKYVVIAIIALALIAIAWFFMQPKAVAQSTPAKSSALKPKALEPAQTGVPVSEPVRLINDQSAAPIPSASSMSFPGAIPPVGSASALATQSAQKPGS